MSRSRPTAQQGVVMVEMVLAFTPMFVLFLGILQIALLSSARLVVQRSAAAGARSAAVVLDDDPRFYEHAERGEIGGPAARAANDERDDQALAERLGFGEPPAATTEQSPPPDPPRLAVIREAVHRPLFAIAPAVELFQPPSVARSLGDPLWRFFAAPFTLADATEIAFPIAPGSDQVYEQHIPQSDLVTVRVTHRFRCQVPIAALLVCGGAHIRLIAEASYPTHDAPYLYESEREGDS